MLGLNELCGQQRALTRTLIQGKIGLRFKPIFSAREQILTCQSDAGKKNSFQTTDRVLLNGSVLDGAGQDKKTRAVVSIRAAAQIGLSVCS